MSEPAERGARRRRGAAVALRALLAIVTLGRSVPAEPGRAVSQNAAPWHPVRVHYRVDPASSWEPCFSHQHVQLAVSRALGREVFVPVEASDVAVVVRAMPEWGVDVRLLDPDGSSLGRRTLKAKGCVELTKLVTFALTVMVDFRSDEVAQKRDAASSESGPNATSTATGDDNPGPDAQGPATGQADPAPPVSALTEPSGERNALSPSRGVPLREVGPATSSEGAPGSKRALRPSFGAAMDTGATPRPLWGVYADLEVGVSAPLVLAVRARGQYMPDVARSVGQLAAGRGALTVNGCWRSTEGAPWSLRICLGATPDVLWVSPHGFETSQSTWFVGLGLETTLASRWPLGRGVALDLGVGLGVPVVRNHWHATTGSGVNRNLFRAEALRTTTFVGLSFDP